MAMWKKKNPNLRCEPCKIFSFIIETRPVFRRGLRNLSLLQNCETWWEKSPRMVDGIKRDWVPVG